MEILRPFILSFEILWMAAAIQIFNDFYLAIKTIFLVFDDIAEFSRENLFLVILRLE